MPLQFEQMAAKGNEFMHELATALNLEHDPRKCNRILRHVLHAFRDMITVEESLQLMAQLPMFLKAIYADGWNGKHVQGIRTVQDLTEFLQVDDRAGISDFPDEETVTYCVQTVFMTLRKFISRGEQENIAAQMPQDLKKLVTVSEEVH